ncbi:NAD-dependent epimerase/dehydratase family protein [Geomonas sp. RF6]|uniref:NAD-dependent epimerase/dehydratase family protein n=1 Tax=Geomonas sp. RF6 TaxID=2897342 RepID=UPI001E408F2D|nr:NAD-dependent epimerase/dehydratase family protein [Geomonas sp. RF6]UFS71311.1 NAD-dependent epimerase/dehydratase family protein [Geomonas sp. RF6]
MKILVTGATGFVGACLTRRLSAGGYDVHVLTRPSSDRWRIADILPRVTEESGDLRDREAVEAVVSRVRPEAVCHFATYGGFSFQDDSAAIFATNLMGTVHLLSACEKLPLKSFVNIGSSSEYGVKGAPMKESDALEPAGSYGIAKAAASLLCRAEALGKGLPTVTLRLFSPYGPWDDRHRLVPYLLSSLLRGRAPQLSTPTSVRDFVFIDDVLHAIEGALQNPPPPGEAYNIGSGVQHSVGDVVALALRLTGSRLEPVWDARTPQRPEPSCWCADLTKLRAHGREFPATPLPVGLERTLSWMRDNLACYP